MGTCLGNTNVKLSGFRSVILKQLAGFADIDMKIRTYM